MTALGTLHSCIFNRHDWTRLRGYFDWVIAYSLKKEHFTSYRDLRILPWLQELVEEPGIIQSYERLRYMMFLIIRHLKVSVRKRVFVSRLSYACPGCWVRR
ncbi:hypothetical protein GF319_08265 [Candidatus Bathyarchaeota archaeon]|nr:hypothetical protein [Candidatus Bathyarchaeota archaeon]